MSLTRLHWLRLSGKSFSLKRIVIIRMSSTNGLPGTRQQIGRNKQYPPALSLTDMHMFMRTQLLQAINRMPEGEQTSSWRPQFIAADAALDELVKEDSDLDAVILVGAVPYPALDKFGMKEIKKSGGLFTRTVKVAPLALLPIGEEADAIFDQNPDFKGYIKTSIKAEEYEFLTGEKGEIPTRGVTACLVTHKAYGSESSEEARKRLLWVRHVLFRLLTNLDQGSESGLNRDVGPPEAGDKWQEIWEHLGRMGSGDLSWNSYGWQRHDDPILRKMVDAWSGSYDKRPVSKVIDPDTF